MEAAIGIDPAKNSLAVAAVDALGRCLALPISNNSKGHRALLRWVGKRGRDRVIGIECAAGTEPGVSRLLLGCGQDVQEVPSTLTHRERRRRASHGKSDLVDSVAIARIAARGEELPSARTLELLTDIRALVGFRDQLVRARIQ